jgi:hypothetical protein
MRRRNAAFLLTAAKLMMCLRKHFEKPKTAEKRDADTRIDICG